MQQFTYHDVSPEAVAARASTRMHAKHELQMQTHQQKFGPLGELQTKAQKKALAKAVENLEKP